MCLQFLYSDLWTLTLPSIVNQSEARVCQKLSSMKENVNQGSHFLLWVVNHSDSFSRHLQFIHEGNFKHICGVLEYTTPLFSYFSLLTIFIP